MQAHLKTQVICMRERFIYILLWNMDLQSNVHVASLFVHHIYGGVKSTGCKYRIRIHIYGRCVRVWHLFWCVGGKV